MDVWYVSIINKNAMNFHRYVAENIEPPAKKTKETDSNLKEQTQCKSDQDFKLTSFQIKHEDLKKNVPDINIIDENLTPPVLEPVYSDIKVTFFSIFVKIKEHTTGGSL